VRGFVDPRLSHSDRTIGSLLGLIVIHTGRPTGMALNFSPKSGSTMTRTDSALALRLLMAPTLAGMVSQFQHTGSLMAAWLSAHQAVLGTAREKRRHPARAVGWND